VAHFVEPRSNEDAQESGPEAGNGEVMRIAMIGSGYVGLVSGVCLSDVGHQVVCVDNDERKIAALRRCEIPIHEPGLEQLVAANLAAGRLSFSTDLPAAVTSADVVFIAVGTPARRGDGHADLSYVYAAAREIAHAIEGFTVVVTKSTVPVGTGDAIERIVRRERPDANVVVVSNPEFLREGAAINDFLHPDRIVIGVDDPKGRAAMQSVYRPLQAAGVPILMVSRRTAELTKYAANAFLATKISFINEIADLCERVGASVDEVANGIGLDKRIGTQFLNAGPGYGGSCFPKDTVALLRTAHDYGMGLRVVESVVAVNEARKPAMARRIADAIGGDVDGKTIAVLGLTFKSDTDDMREAPAIAIIDSLQRGGATIRAYDPVGVAQARNHLTDVVYADDPYHCANGADALVVITDWRCFRELDLARIARLLASPVVVDLRNIYEPEAMERFGFRYISIGRPPSDRRDVGPQSEARRVARGRNGVEHELALSA
jgi:UDPglucose 6-dehydrogenase